MKSLIERQENKSRLIPLRSDGNQTISKINRELVAALTVQNVFNVMRVDVSEFWCDINEKQ